MPRPSLPGRWVLVASLVALLHGLGAWAEPATAAEFPSGGYFSDMTTEFALGDRAGPAWTPGWVDIDLDGRAEPFFVSHDAMFYLNHSSEEGVTSHDVVVLGAGLGSTFGHSAQQQPVVVSGDFDRDGRVDIVTFGEGLNVFTITSPGVLELQSIVSPPLPVATHVIDAAAADLNGDGWPDIVVGLGRVAQEHFYVTGARDVIYMNRGGHFERQLLQPSVAGRTQGIVAADMDGDGRVDLVESLDFSQTAGFSRVLLNVGEVGEASPTFKREVAGFDIGSFGMGVAVADVNGDGLIDVYNTSGGRDALRLKLPGDGYLDANESWGIRHEFGRDGFRTQWSPTFVDVNADGRLDLFVRHASMPMGGVSQMAQSPHMNLLYLGRSQEGMQRVAVPFQADTAFQGVNAVFGDLDGDGFPDVALGGAVLGTGAHATQGRPGFWRNTSTGVAAGRRFMLRLQPTVSANPPVGAEVAATCADVAITRIFNTGGKVGGLVATEVHLAWEQGCEEVQVSVRWPSGVRSDHAFTGGSHVFTAAEPTWFGIESAGETEHRVHLWDPDACFLGSGDTEASCCNIEEPCSFPLEPGEKSPGRVYFPGEQARALPASVGFHTLTTQPHFPAPGEPFLVRASHRGGWGDSGEPWLRIDGVKAPWDGAPSSLGVRSLTYASEGAPQMTVFVESTEMLEAVVPLGHVFDPRSPHPAVWPYQDPANEQKSWRFVFDPGGPSAGDGLSTLSVWRSDGTVVDSVKRYLDPGGRVVVEVPWSQLAVSTELSIHEGEGVIFEGLPAYRVEPGTSLDHKAHSIRGFNGRPVVEPGGGLTMVAFTILDADGFPLPPSCVEVDVQTEGLEIKGGFTFPVLMFWEKVVGFASTAAPGTATLSFRIPSTGKLLAQWKVEVQDPGNTPVDLNQSSLTLDTNILVAGGEGQATLTIRAVDTYGELMAGAVKFEVESDDGIFVSPVRPAPGGVHALTVTPGHFGGFYSITVRTKDGSLGTLTLEVVGDPRQDPPYQLSASERHPENAPDPGGAGTGCRAGQDLPLSLVVLWALIWAACRGLRKRRESMLAMVLLGVLSLGPSDARSAVPPSAQYSDQTEALGLGVYEGPSWAPGWVDIDLDGRAEPFFVSADAMFYLDYTLDGGVQVHDVVVLGAGVDKPFAAKVGGHPIVVSGDFDRDGHIDLLAIQHPMRMFTIVSPGVLEEKPLVAQQLPPGTQVLDAAAADFNGDGWPDVVLGLGAPGIPYHVYPMGTPDLILVNRGGHFVSEPLLPSRWGHTNGIVAADVNRDGKPDIIESFDFSPVAGFSRVLINTTQPGAVAPSFLPEEAGYDRGTFGMGAAVADLNGDGLVDIYNTSSGRDLLAIKQADGGYTDAGADWGIMHEYGDEGVRIQWSPSITDVNGDGLLDVFIRHSSILAGSHEGVVDSPQMSILYLGQHKGGFARVPVPFQPDTTFQGINAVLGDLNGDGLPEVAFGGQVRGTLDPALPGRPEFWLNVSLAEGSGRRLTLRLMPSVSANPPVGAWVNATCGGVEMTRLFSTGGKVGGLVPTEVSLAWGAPCGEVSVSVRWPSGVVSSHVIEPMAGLAFAHEPEWFKMTALPESEPEVTLLHPEACFSASVGSEALCCAGEASCSFPASLAHATPGQVWVEGGPKLSLPPVAGFRTLVTEPHFPAPGVPFQIRVGTGGAWETGAAPWVRIAGNMIPWDADMSGASVKVATHTTEGTSPSVEIDLLVGAKVVSETLVPLGLVADPRTKVTALWPYQDPIHESQMWRFMFLPGHHGLSLNKALLTVRRQDGSDLSAFKRYVGPGGRVFVEVPWEELPDDEALSIYESGRLIYGPLPAYPVQAGDNLDHRAASIRGLSQRPTVDAGALNQLGFSVLDADGYPLPPGNVTIVVESDGFEVKGGGALAQTMKWERLFQLVAGAQLGPAAITFRAETTGKVLGEWNLQVRSPVHEAIDWGQSSVSIDYETLPAGVGARANLTVRIMNAFGEIVGGHVPLQVEADPGIFVSPLTPTPIGTYTLTVEPGFFGGTFTIRVLTVDGVLGAVDVEVVGPSAPSTPHGATHVADSNEGSDAGSSVSPPSGGCQGAPPSRWPATLLWLGLLTVLRAPKRRPSG